MPTVFVSHASLDDGRSRTLESWLRDNGFTDFFIDHQSIAGGEKWADALRASAGACRVVLCLVSEHWLASDECFAEFRAAWYMGKRIIPLLLLRNAIGAGAPRLAKVTAEYQGIDFTGCLAPDGSLDLSRDRAASDRLAEGLRAAGALVDVGLDPEAFAIDRAKRANPFPGLASFGDDDADAALFFGRSREIAETLEALRQMRATADRRPFVIFGASGAGKSSLLKAGIVPRLRREAPAWIAMRVFRSGADPLLNLADAIARTLADFDKEEASGAVRDRLWSAWREADRDKDRELTAAGRAAVVAALEAEGKALRAAADRPDATILLGVDQAEELARAAGPAGEALCDILRAALTAPSNWQLAFTIRTDSFPEVQAHNRFRDLTARGYDLRALPAFRFESVVDKPAGRYGVLVETQLIDELVGDAPKDDALPLLAFAMQRLWRYAPTKVLKKEHYLSLGRLIGLIEDAAERALHGIRPDVDVPLPAGEPPRRVTKLAADTFVPAMAQLNDQGQTIKRVARWTRFDPEAQRLLEDFHQWRLVVRKPADFEGGTVEVVHESLFRGWTRLKGWLEAEKERLDTLQLVESAAAVWQRKGRHWSWLNHRGWRLRAARRLVREERYRDRLDSLGRAYLDACRRFVVWRASAVAAATFVLLLAGLGVASVLDSREAFGVFVSEADRLNQRAEDTEEKQHFEGAARHALAAMRTSTANFDGQSRECFGATVHSIAECELRRSGMLEPVVRRAAITEDPDFPKLASSTRGRDVHVRTSTYRASLFEGGRTVVKTRTREVSFNMPSSEATGVDYLVADSKATRLIVLYDTRPAALWDLTSEPAKIAELSGNTSSQIIGSIRTSVSITFNENETHFFTRLGPLPTSLWKSLDGSLVATLDIAEASFVAGGNVVLVQRVGNRPAQLMSAEDGRVFATLASDIESTRSVSVNKNRTLGAIANSRHSIDIWDLKTGTHVARLPGHGSRILDIVWSDDSERIVSTSVDEQLKIWDVGARRELISHQMAIKDNWGPSFQNVGVASAANGRLAISTNANGLLIWNGEKLLNAAPGTQAAGKFIYPVERFSIMSFSKSGDKVVSFRRRAFGVFEATAGKLEAVVRVSDLGDFAKVDRFDRRDPDAGVTVGFVDGSSARVAADLARSVTWEIRERGRHHGADLSAWMCGQERRNLDPKVFVFSNGERRSNSFLMGRPADVCEWEGLSTAAGWRQLWSRWRYLLTGTDAYAAATTPEG